MATDDKSLALKALEVSLPLVLGKGGDAFIERYKLKHSTESAGPQESGVRDWAKAMDRIAALDLPAEAKAELEIARLGTRILQGVIDREAERLHRRSLIVEQAATNIPSSTDVYELDVNWKESFDDHAGSAGTSQLQSLWAHILSAEAVAPGSFSKRAMDELGKFDQRDIATLVAISSRTIFSDQSIMLYDPDEEDEEFDAHLRHGAGIGLLAPLLPFETASHYSVDITAYEGVPMPMRLSSGKSFSFMARKSSIMLTKGIGLTHLGKQLGLLPLVPPHDKLVRSFFRNLLAAGKLDADPDYLLEV